MSLTEDKKRLRTLCLQKRSALSPADKAMWDAALCRHIAKTDAFQKAPLILLFSPVRGEPDLTPLFALAKEAGKAVAFPRCEGKAMTFHTVEALTELKADKYGIPAPVAGLMPAPTDCHTLCILPGLAGGEDGTRLGYGGGFYDRFLDTFGGITLFPLYECFVYPTLPVAATDKTADLLITEKGERLRHV